MSSQKFSFKLTYFNVKGAAETTRMMFAAAGVKYTDERISFDDWPKLKPNTPQGVLPLLTIEGEGIDGKATVVQSNAIARCIARQFNFYGKDNKESTRIDQINETLSDLFQCFRQGFLEKDEAKKAELLKKAKTEDAPRILGYVEKLVEKFGSDGYAVSNCLSLADIAIHATSDVLGIRDELNKCKRLAAVIKRVEENKGIAKWLKERPVTER